MFLSDAQSGLADSSSSTTKWAAWGQKQAASWNPLSQYGYESGIWKRTLSKTS